MTRITEVAAVLCVVVAMSVFATRAHAQSEWGGSYTDNLNEARTNFTDLNVFETFHPQIPKEYADTELVELFLTAGAFEMFPRFIDGLHIPVTPLPSSK